MKADLITRIEQSAIIGENVSWVERPAGKSLPWITLQGVSSGREYTHAGVDALATPRVQADVWGRSHLEVTTLGDALIATLEPAADVGGTRFGRAFVDGDRDFEPEIIGGGTKVFRRSIDFFIWHEPLG